jgi:hypothetical protein
VFASIQHRELGLPYFNTTFHVIDVSKEFAYASTLLARPILMIVVLVMVVLPARENS